MIYILNNNTTHNYSKYSTRPSHIYRALLKVRYPIQNIPNSKMFETDQSYLFQTKQLLCWGPDLAFLNLRNTFSNIFKALQICWSAARNNKKIVFINGNDAIEADSLLVNTWLIQQCKRHIMPRKLSNISNIAAKYINNLAVKSKPSNTTKKSNQISSLPSKALFNNFNIFLSSLKSKTSYLENRNDQRFITNSNALINSIPIQLIQNYKLKGGLEAPEAKNLENNTIDQSLYNNDEQYVVNNHNQLQSKTLKILKIKKAIQLQVKEGQTLTQQIAGEITAPLVGFLTNTKTGFNTLQNQLNEEYYNHCRSVDFNNTSKSVMKSLITIDPSTKTNSALTPVIPQGIYKNYILSLKTIGQLNFKEAVYNQKYLPFSFYIRPVTKFNLSTSGESPIRQNIFGNIFAWRLKGQHLSSIFYSQFKIFDQRAKHKRKQLTTPNQNNMEAFKEIGQLQFPSSKPQVLFQNSNNFITFKSSRINKASFDFYLSALSPDLLQRKKQRERDTSSRINSKESRVRRLSLFIRLKCKNNSPSKDSKDGEDLSALAFAVAKVKKSNNYSNKSINSFYVNRFYLEKQRLLEMVDQRVKTGRVDGNRAKNIIKSNRSSIASLFKNNTIFKAYKNQRITKRVTAKLFRQSKKQGHYSRLVNSNQLSQYQMFAKSRFLNNKLGDIVFFINPEKNQNLVNQANALKIPTIGVISGIATSQLGRHSCNYYNLNNLVNYPILGNPSSSVFIYTLIGIFIKTLRSS